MKKTREITQLEFDESSKSEEKSGWIVSNYLFFLSKQKINCTLQTFSIKIEDTFILTIFAESPRLFNYLNQIIYNNEN